MRKMRGFLLLHRYTVAGAANKQKPARNSGRAQFTSFNFTNSPDMSDSSRAGGLRNGVKPTGASWLLRGRDLSLPRPATVDFKHQTPTQERADQNQTSKQAKAGKRQLDGYRLHDIGSHQYFESKQERSTDPDSVSVVVPLVA